MGIYGNVTRKVTKLICKSRKKVPFVPKISTLRESLEPDRCHHIREGGIKTTQDKTSLGISEIRRHSVQAGTSETGGLESDSGDQHLE